MRRAALESVGGFDDTLIAGEEPEMCGRMGVHGWRIQHIDHQMTLHDLAITRFSQYWRRSQRAGYAFAAVSDRFRNTPGKLWSSDARRNRVRGLFWLLSPLAAIAASILWRSLLLVAAWILLLLALAARTAWQNRWKLVSWTTLLLYGIHSHLQQIPILWGQVQFLLNRNKPLIEYKDVLPAAEKLTQEELETRQP